MKRRGAEALFNVTWERKIIVNVTVAFIYRPNGAVMEPLKMQNHRAASDQQYRSIMDETCNLTGIRYTKDQPTMKLFQRKARRSSILLRSTERASSEASGSTGVPH